jgi:trimethylamine:corrinoid methyltransferase-like protein
VLNEYVEPPMDLAIREEFVAFVDRRKAKRGRSNRFLMPKKCPALE